MENGTLESYRNRKIDSVILARVLSISAGLMLILTLIGTPGLADGDAPAAQAHAVGIDTSEPCVTGEEQCLERLPMSEGTQFFPYYRTYSLAIPNARITQAVIVTHGNGRTAADYFRAMVHGVEMAELLGSTLVIAPHFKARGSTCQDPVERGELYWSCSGWIDGEAARNSPPGAPIYSFAVIDRFLQILDDPLLFPHLQKITVTGHSAGGQFTQRYAAANPMEPKIVAPIKYIIANPSSYMYLNDLRVEQDATCYEDETCSGDFVYFWDRQNCPEYNDYKYGMDHRTGYIALVGEAALREQFTTRAVTYLLGELDTRVDGALDVRCPANAQGRQRRERGTIFWNYIRRHYRADHTFFIVPGCGHSEGCMYGSAEALSAVLF